MTLDLNVKKILENMNMPGAPSSAGVNNMTPKEYRRLYNETKENKRIKYPPEEVGEVNDLLVPGPHGEIPIRIYYPQTKNSPPLPIIIYFHGGGFVYGNLDSHDPICRTLTNGTNSIVVSVDYRLAPEYKFPIAVEEAFTILEWVYNGHVVGGNQHLIALAGDSAGGNLAAVSSILAGEKGLSQPKFQVLFYPFLGAGETNSLLEKGEGLYLTREKIDWVTELYARNEKDLSNPYFRPYLYKDLSKMPSTLIINAEYDPIRDDGKLFADRLLEADVNVEYKEYSGMIHGFIGMADELQQGADALNYSIEKLNEVFND